MAGFAKRKYRPTVSRSIPSSRLAGDTSPRPAALIRISPTVNIASGCPGEEVVKRQHRVGFAAAEVGLELHHRITALTRDAPHRTDEQTLEALREVSPAEEFGRLLILQLLYRSRSGYRLC
jgi:hypothetical protein